MLSSIANIDRSSTEASLDVILFANVLADHGMAREASTRILSVKSRRHAVGKWTSHRRSGWKCCKAIS